MSVGNLGPKKVIEEIELAVIKPLVVDYKGNILEKNLQRICMTRSGVRQLVRLPSKIYNCNVQGFRVLI